MPGESLWQGIFAKVSRLLTTARNLSAPMMQVLPKDEMLSIIGHELGHFKGEDTQMTRHLTPLLMKSDGTMLHLAQGGWIGRPALHAMNVFNYLFDHVISAYRRERELHADAFGARVTHPETVATALVRYTYQAEAYAAAFGEHLSTQAALEASLLKFQDLLSRDDLFWSQMAAHATPHPFDSHPPLTQRLEKLGFKIEDVRHKAIKNVETSSFDVLMKGKSEALQKAIDQHTDLVRDAQARLSIKETAADQLPPELIQRHFPQVVLKARKWRLAALTLVLFALMVVLPGYVMTLDTATPFLQAFMAALLVAGLWGCWALWRSRSDVLTLNHLGIQLASWREMLKFEEVAQIQHMQYNGSEQVIFTFKNKRPPIARRPLLKFKRKKVSVNLAGFEGKQRDNVIRIFRYYTRELEG